MKTPARNWTSLELKREIFAALGQNFLVKDKKVTISGCEWFVPIQKAYPALEVEYKRLELNENGSINEKTPAFAEVISRWGHIVEVVRTAITNLSLCSFIPDYQKL
jgi:hypothetical protein